MLLATLSNIDKNTLSCSCLFCSLPGFMSVSYCSSSPLASKREGTMITSGGWLNSEGTNNRDKVADDEFQSLTRRHNGRMTSRRHAVLSADKLVTDIGQ